MPVELLTEYAASLASLIGNDFQAEVCARLQSVYIGFQTIPAKPQGDAGLDGFSHHGEHGYCCYGPDPTQFTTSRKREQQIITKFKDDLLKLFELEANKKALACISNPELPTILPNGVKLKHIELISNWFESHRVLGPIHSAVAEYARASKCSYVDSGVNVIVVGPKELANRFAVDELTILRARQRTLARKVQKTAATITITDSKTFDTKMSNLKEIRPDQLQAIRSLVDRFRDAWKMALAFERELDESLPGLHRMLDEDRLRILRRVSELMLATKEPWTELMRAEEIAESILERDFGKNYGSLLQDVSSGEIARLIGECPIGWEKSIKDA